MVSMKKMVALSVAHFILCEVEPESKESTVSMYMRWKEKTHIILHNPDNARYVLEKFTELGHMNQQERDSFAAATKCELQYVKRNL